jgi:hypothetical protein
MLQLIIYFITKNVYCHFVFLNNINVNHKNIK